jgi:hypothetical protein
VFRSYRLDRYENIEGIARFIVSVPPKQSHTCHQTEILHIVTVSKIESDECLVVTEAGKYLNKLVQYQFVKQVCD